LGFDTTKKAKAEFEETAKLEILFLSHFSSHGVSESSSSRTTNLEHTPNYLSSDGSESTCESSETTPLKVFL